MPGKMLAGSTMDRRHTAASLTDIAMLIKERRDPVKRDEHVFRCCATPEDDAVEHVDNGGCEITGERLSDC